jgi:hypothetical protein
MPEKGGKGGKHMTNTPSTALSRANALQSGYGGLCLAFCGWCYNVPAKYPSAIDSWNHQGAHNHPTSNVHDVPVGYPIYFSQAGNPYGHIAIYAGNGMMRTTYSPDNRIHTMSVALWQSWGYHLLGWSEAIDGTPISKTVAATATKPTTTTVLTQQEVIMAALMIRDDDTGVVYLWIPEIGRIGLTHPDQMKVLETAGVKLMHGSKGAPWWARADEITSLTQTKMKKAGLLK